MGLGDGYSPWLPLTVSWKFVYAKEKKSSHVISDDIHSICPINRTCPLKKNNNKKKSSFFTFPFCSRGHGPYITLAFFLLVTGPSDLEGREWGDAFPFWGYCVKTELSGDWQKPPQPQPVCCFAPTRLLLLPQQLQKGLGLRLLPAPSLGSFTQGNKHRGNRAAAETVLTGAKDFANWKQ